jgi:hypothetical protein
MKPPSILTALRTGAYLHHLQLLSEAPARLADFYGSVMDMTVKPLGDDLWLCQGPTCRILSVKGIQKLLGFAPSLAAIRLGSMSSGLEPQPKGSNTPPHRVLCSRTSVLCL